jgi:DNA invertase Pin-like site-specific DNA recombinase
MSDAAAELTGDGATIAAGSAATKTALLYLRVSPAAQTQTDYDQEGLSLPAQRDACTRKATSLGATVADVFVERGESGRSTARRSALAAMLTRLDARDINTVIVHKVDRLARKRADDSTILAQIRASGAQLVSVSENVDETPSGMLLHGIMASIAEFYSMNLAAESSRHHRKSQAGRHALPSTTWLPQRPRVSGREVRTIDLDTSTSSAVAGSTVNVNSRTTGSRPSKRRSKSTTPRSS